MWTPQGWNLIFRRFLNDWEIDRVTEFTASLNNSVVQAGEDVLRWQGNSNGDFKVNAAYRMMNQSKQQIDKWPWKHIWRTNIPHKVACLVWLLAKEAVLTRDNLMRRKNTMCSRCFFMLLK